MTRFPPLVSRLIPSLGRENEHEVVATARAIGSALRAAGLDLGHLAAVVSASVPFSHSEPASPTCFGDLARACRDLDAGQLTERERAFVADMCRRGFSYGASDRQMSWLRALHERLSRRAAA